MYRRVSPWVRVGLSFCFVTLDTDVNSFLRDLISTDLYGRIVQQHPCSKCTCYSQSYCNYLEILWMYQLQDNVFFAEWIIFCPLNEELCKVCFEDHFCLYIDYNVWVCNQTGNIIKLYIVISSDKCIYYYFVHAHSLSTMMTAEALFNNKKSVFKKPNIT